MNNTIVKLWDQRTNVGLAEKPRFWLVLYIDKQNDLVTLLNITSKKNPYLIKIPTNCKMLSIDSFVITNNVMYLEQDDDLNLYLFNNCSCTNGCLPKEKMDVIKNDFRKMKEALFNTEIDAKVTTLEPLSKWGKRLPNGLNKIPKKLKYK